MFLVGLELDLKLLGERAHTTVVTSHASILVPFILGAALGPDIQQDRPAESLYLGQRFSAISEMLRHQFERKHSHVRVRMFDQPIHQIARIEAGVRQGTGCRLGAQARPGRVGQLAQVRFPDPDHSGRSSQTRHACQS